VSIQLGHAGRKASSHVPWNSGKLIPQSEGGWWPEAPSAVPITATEPAPEAISPAALDGILKDFVRAAQRAQEMGIEAVELHGAHGYLLHEFLSPISNQRSDNFGGSFENRIRFPLQVFEAVRQVYSGSLGMRLSATDWVEGGWTAEETADFSLRLKQAGANFMHISSGGVSPQQKINLVPGYQVPFAKMVKDKSGLPTMAVGLITEAAHAESIVANQEADLVAFAQLFVQPTLGLGSRRRAQRLSTSHPRLLALHAPRGAAHFQHRQSGHALNSFTTSLSSPRVMCAAPGTPFKWVHPPASPCAPWGSANASATLLSCGCCPSAWIRS
jgi:2,4-dienoyl-CoA reductase-like NADH-dependent reductase (Old Yellow Enzyme family)